MEVQVFGGSLFRVRVFRRFGVSGTVFHVSGFRGLEFRVRVFGVCGSGFLRFGVSGTGGDGSVFRVRFRGSGFRDAGFPVRRLAVWGFPGSLF